MIHPITEILANGVAVIHAAILALYAAGGATALLGGFCRGSLMLWQRLYLGLVFLLSLSVLLADRCPLTQLENALRAAHPPDTSYDGSFLEHYLPGMPQSIDVVGSVILLLAGCVATLSVLACRLRESVDKSSPALNR